MQTNKFYLFMVLFFISVLGYFTYEIFKPFLTAIAWAIVLCIVFYPVYAWALVRIKIRAIAAVLTLILIIVVTAGPFSYVAFALMTEVGEFVGKADSGGMETIRKVVSDERIASVIERIQPYIGFKEVPTEKIVIENARKFGAGIVDKISSGFTNILGVAVNFTIMLFTSFFFLKDGPGYLKKLGNYLPFSEDQKYRLAVQTKDMVVSTIYGGVVVALTQGLLGGIALAVLGVNSPVLWGSVMAIVSFVPVFGTAVVWIPASLIFLFEGAYIKGIVLIFIGVFVISMVDNLLKPLIIGGRTRMPTIVIFFTVLGGIKFFGLLGLIMGPLVFALFISVFEIFRSMEGGADA